VSPERHRSLQRRYSRGVRYPCGREKRLDPSDRAALQSMITLAGTLGAGTIFALFFAGRRRGAEYVVFEVFAIAAVLASLATTAYFSIALLHRHEAISDHELAETATPLIVAVFLLVLISVFARLPGSRQRLLALVPLALVAVAAAAELGSTTWSATPDNGLLVALLILVAGLLLAFAVWAVGRALRSAERRRAFRRFDGLAGHGFVPAEASLAAVVPSEDGERRPRLLGWGRRDRFYLDAAGAKRLVRLVEERWDAVAAGELGYPPGSPVLRSLELEPGEQGLFDVTDLVRPG
jgi:7TM diverse intracellular signalling